MKKFISVFTALTTTLWLVGGLFVIPVHAAIVDGDIVREASQFDVYIIKLVGTDKFKRLILNPDVFNMYGHLKWENVKVVAAGTLDAYTTSELVREINDTKVYKLYPDGDTGTKKWVDTLDCFTTQGYNWNSVYIINSFDRDSYTTASTTLCGEAEVAGDITVSLAPDSPAGDTIPINAANVTFAKFKFAGSGTITQLVLKRSGAGDTNDFLNVYLYDGDNRLVNGRSVSSATSKVTFINLDIKAPATISVVTDMSWDNANAGNVNYFEIESASSITSNATIGGTFPIKGSNMATAGAEGGYLALTKPGSITDPKVGQQNALLSEFKLTAGLEAIDMKRIRMINGGDIAPSKLTNLELKVGSAVVATAAAVDDDNYATFVFSPAYTILKGDNAIFYVYGDIAGSAKVGDTIKFYFEVGNDIYGVGKTYGFGASTVTSTTSDASRIGDMDASGDAHSLTLEGGALTIAFNGPVASDISEKGKDVVYLDLTLTAAQDIEIRKTRVVICWADGGTTYTALDPTNGSANWTKIKDEIEDIKLVNKDTGAVIAGPVDADASGWAAGDDASSCTGTVDGAYYDYTDTYNIAAGESLNVQATFDFANSLTDITAGDWFSMVLEGWANTDLCSTTGDINVMRYTGTTTAVDDSDIVPSTDTVGNNMAVISPELRIGLAALPQSATYVKGTKLIDVVGFTLEATKGSDITITQFKPTAYVSNAGITFAVGADSTLIAKNLMSGVYLYEGTTKIAGPVGFSGTTDRYVDFDNLTYVVPAGVTKTVTIKVDLHNYILTSPDYLTFTLGSSDDIATQDDEGNDLTEKDSNGGAYTAADTNGETSPTRKTTVTGAGTLAVEALDTPSSTAVYFGQTNAELAKYRFSATNEGVYIDKLNVVVSAASGGQQEADNIDEFTNLTLVYTNKAGNTLAKTLEFGATATVSFTGFASVDRPYVPKDGDLTVTVKGNMNTWALGADSGEQFYVDVESTVAGDFEATGDGSGAKLSGTDIGAANGQQMYIYRMFPEFAKVTTTTLEANDGKINGSTEEAVLRFTITAIGEPGAPDLLFDAVIDVAHLTTAPVTSGLIQFEIVASGASDTTPDFYLYDVTTTETLMYSSDNADSEFGGSTENSENASAAVNLGIATTEQDLLIPVGQTKTYELRVDLSSFDDPAVTGVGADYFSANLYLNEANVVQYVDRSKSDKLGTITNMANIFKNKITGTVLYRE